MLTNFEIVCNHLIRILAGAVDKKQLFWWRHDLRSQLRRFQQYLWEHDVPFNKVSAARISYLKTTIWGSFFFRYPNNQLIQKAIGVFNR